MNALLSIIAQHRDVIACMLLVWIWLQNTDEKHVCLNVYLPYRIVRIRVSNKDSNESGEVLIGCSTVLRFSKLNKIFYGYFDPEKIFLDNENK